MTDSKPNDPQVALGRWQTKLLPFMMAGLGVIAVLFFIGTFWNYTSLHSRFEYRGADISQSIEKLRTSDVSQSYQDWYLRVILEEQALRSRHHQNAAVIESRVWTRFMGFMTGIVMVMAGCIFILGKLDAQFDGVGKVLGNEGALKTNSPGIVLAVVGAVLIGISLVVSLNIEVNDRPVYMPSLTQVSRESMPPPHALESLDKKVDLPRGLADEICGQAGKPAGCMAAASASVPSAKRPKERK